jgi:hypothetical protein
MSIINQIELHKKISLCEWCKSTISLQMNNFVIYKRKKVIFMCPVCHQYSKTNCVSLSKIKWYRSLHKYAESPIVSRKVSHEAEGQSKKKHHKTRENDWFTLPI